MTTSNYISFILLGVIGLVFLIDFIIKSREKSLEKSVEKFVEKEKFGKKKWFNLKTFFWTYPIPAIIYILIPYFLLDMNFGKYLDFLSESGRWGWVSDWWLVIFIPLAIHIVWFIYSLNVNWNLFLNWNFKRKKNISISVLIIVILKITIHYFFYINVSCQKFNQKIEGWADTEFLQPVVWESKTVTWTGCAEFKDFVNAVLFDVRVYPFLDGVATEDLPFHSKDIFRFESFYLDARLHLFIPIILIYILIVWFFNDKIKIK